jgi:hypothetical protein
MKFERLHSGDFLIDGKLIRASAFMMLEPNYSEPIGTLYLKYENDGSTPYRMVKTKETQYKIFGVWQDGERYCKRINDLNKLSFSIETSINSEEAEISEDIKTALTQKKILSYSDKRKLEYPSIEELVVAMWENLIEKKTKTDSGVSELQKLRKQIRDKYPSENTNALSQNETEIS